MEERESSNINVAVDNARVLNNLLNFEAIQCSSNGDNGRWVTILLSVLRVGSVYFEDEEITYFNKKFSKLDLSNPTKQRQTATNLHLLEVELRAKLKDILKASSEDDFN